MYQDIKIVTKGYHKLIVWQKAHQLVLEIYKVTSIFPKEEKYDLTDQLRRSAKSVPTNIVEGQASEFLKVFLNFLDKANGSLVETEYHLELARDLHYLSQAEYTRLDALREEIGILLHALRNSIRKKL